MKKILSLTIILVLLTSFFLTACSVENDLDLPPKKIPPNDFQEDDPAKISYDHETYTYQPLELEDPFTNTVSYTVGSESTASIDTTKIVYTDYALVNPTTSAELELRVYRPDTETKNPAVILIPGGLGGMEEMVNSRLHKYSAPEAFAANGFTVLVFSPDGRGESTGEEDYNGFLQQDGLYEVYRFLSELDHVQTDNIGIVSYSYGVALASGMIARYQPDLKYYIEWEGPVNRYYVTMYCRAKGAIPTGMTCDDEDYWLEREALRFVPYFDLDYFLIVQKDEDHAQPNNMHSLEINNFAINYLPWVRVNGPENEVNQDYSLETLPTFPGKEFQEEILSYMQEFSEN